MKWALDAIDEAVGHDMSDALGAGPLGQGCQDLCPAAEHLALSMPAGVLMHQLDQFVIAKLVEIPEEAVGELCEGFVDRLRC